jgi:hypothetical protein
MMRWLFLVAMVGCGTTAALEALPTPTPEAGAEAQADAAVVETLSDGAVVVVTPDGAVQPPEDAGVVEDVAPDVVKIDPCAHKICVNAPDPVPTDSGSCGYTRCGSNKHCDSDGGCS